MKFVVLFASTDTRPETAPFTGAYLDTNEHGATLWHVDLSSLEEFVQKIAEVDCDFIVSKDRVITIYDARIE
jgi:hypothetical protein